MTEIIRSSAYLIERFILQKEYLLASSKYGVKFKFKAADAVGRSIYKHKEYEPEITRFVLNEIQYNTNDIIIDIGANIGWYALHLEKIAKLDRIYAFEPDPLNYALLQENMQLNTATKIVAINKALADKNGTAMLYKYGEKNLGRHSMLPLFNGDSEKVETILLDDFVTKYQNKKQIKLIKIDVEGYEAQVLQGAIATLEHTDNLIMEFSPRLMLQHNIMPQSVIELLFNKGFLPYFFEATTITPVNKEFLLQATEMVTMLWRKQFI